MDRAARDRAWRRRCVLIAVSGGGATPLQIERYGYARRLAHFGVQGAELARANTTIDHYFSYLAGDIGLAALRASYDEVRTMPWFAGLGVAQITPSESARAQWRWIPTYDPAADIANLHVPTLVMLAGSDGDTSLRDAVSGWASALARSAVHDARILICPEADHHMGVAAGRGWRRLSSADRSEVARFLTMQR